MSAREKVVRLTSITHELKAWPMFFDGVLARTKTFEVRQNDRDFHAGDRLVLREFVPCASCEGRGTVTVESYMDTVCPACECTKGQYTGRSLRREVLEVFHGLPGVQRGYVVMSLGND